MKNEVQEIRGMMRYGYLSTTGRGLTARLKNAQKPVSPSRSAADAFAAPDLSAPYTTAGISTLLILAWQLGYVL